MKIALLAFILTFSFAFSAALTVDDFRALKTANVDVRRQILGRHLQDADGNGVDDDCEAAIVRLTQYPALTAAEEAWEEQLALSLTAGPDCLLLNEFVFDGIGDPNCVINGQNSASENLAQACRDAGFNPYLINTLETCTGVPLANGTIITATYELKNWPLCAPCICDINQYEEYYEADENSLEDSYNASECVYELTHQKLQGACSGAVSFYGGSLPALGVLLVSVSLMFA